MAGFVHTDGKYLIDREGNRTTFRGTNLGGWMMQEGWMSPLGDGGLSKTFFAAVYADSAAEGHGPELAIDENEDGGLISGNLETYWQSAIPQESYNIEFKIELDRQRRFNSVVLETGAGHEEEYIRGGHIEVSNDGVNDWAPVENLSIDTSKATQGIIKIKFDEIVGRFISIRPTASGPNFEPWTIADLNVCISDEFTIRKNLIRRFGEQAMIDLYADYHANWITEADLDVIAGMNMNFVRVPIYWMEFAYSDGTIRDYGDAKSGFAKLDWLIENCEARGLHILIDLHGVPGGANGWASGGQAGPIPTELFFGDPAVVEYNQDLLERIWVAVASRYKDNTTVAAYGLMNEPVLGFPENAEQVDVKYALFDRLYKTVRAIDENHIIVFEEFGEWSVAENRPERATWENYMFEKHPYERNNRNNWWMQNNLVNAQTSTLTRITNSWNIPLLVGEFNLFSFPDMWDKFTSALNENAISWSNWTYKVRGTQGESGGGNWGYYNTWSGEVPDILHDSPEEIRQKWLNTQSEAAFYRNQGFMNIVTRRADGSVSPGFEQLGLEGFTATASHNPYNNTYNIFDNNSATRWSTGEKAKAGMWLCVDCGEETVWDMFELNAGNWTDYPVQYKVSVSNDGEDFTDIELDTSDLGFGQKIMVLATQTQKSRYIKVTLLQDKDNWWAVAIFNLFRWAE